MSESIDKMLNFQHADYYFGTKGRQTFIKLNYIFKFVDAKHLYIEAQLSAPHSQSRLVHLF